MQANFTEFESLCAEANVDIFAVAEQMVRNLMGANATGLNITVLNVTQGSIIIDYIVESLDKGLIQAGLATLNATVGAAEEVVVSEELDLRFDVVIAESTFILTDAPTPAPTPPPLDPQQAPEPTEAAESESSDSSGAIVGAVLSVLLVVGVVIAVLVWRKRKGEAQDVAAAAEEEEPARGADELEPLNAAESEVMSDADARAQQVDQMPAEVIEDLKVVLDARNKQAAGDDAAADNEQHHD